MLHPKVTVSIITYNHAPFIAQAIESVLMQKTDFPFEVVIGEDDSSDGTREIVQRYAAEHPDKIRLHLHSRSTNISYQGKPTGRHNLVHNLQSARGEYLALLDGDDYWTDPLKLQLQADYLDAHRECATCFCPSHTVDEQGAPIETPPTLLVTRSSYQLVHFFAGEFQARLSTIMYRRGLFGKFPDWYYTLPAGDYPLHFLNGQHGEFAPINRDMVAYRVHSGGVWTQGFNDDDFFQHAPAALQIRRLGVMIELQKMALRWCGPAYGPVLLPQLILRTLRLADLHWAARDWAAMRRAVRGALRLQPWRRNFPWLRVLRGLLVSHFPFLARKSALKPSFSAVQG